MSGLILFGALLAASALGVAAHELTHYVVWTLTGRNPEVDVLAVATKADVDRIRLGDRVAALSPILVGIALIGGVVASNSLTAPLGLFLAFYTLGGVWLGGGVGSDIRVALTTRPAE